MNLITAFDIRRQDLVALVGGGGKSSLLLAFGRSWPGRAILTSTTRLAREQINLAPAALKLRELDRLEAQLKIHGRCLIYDQIDGDKALGVRPELPAHWLAHSGVDLVVVEADGSRLRPVKAPREGEPVIPAAATLVIVVVGMDALEQPLREAAHRPHLVCELTGLGLDDTLSPAGVAALVNHPRGGLKHVPPQARVMVCLNKVETPDRQALAREAAGAILAGNRISRVVLTALHQADPVISVVSGRFPS